MDDLLTWFRAQLDTDEQTAKRVAPDQSPNDLRAMVTRDGSDPFLIIDSARLQAEIQAKRAILQLFEISSMSREVHADAWQFMKRAVRELAAPYADRPGYLEKWKP